MDTVLHQIVGNIVPPAAAAGLVVMLARLLAANWLRELGEFRARVDHHMEATRGFPEFREQTIKRRAEVDKVFDEVRGYSEFKGRTEDRLRRLYEVDQKVSSLEYAVAGVKTDLTSLRTDVKEGTRDLRGDMERLSEKLDDIFRRAFGAKDPH